ncbi:MAG: nucleotide exchange factor GrpE [Bacteroidales bacterium]|nr:nucleotide exchange factor GrpE [Bacteroidales bacterium]
MKFKFLRNMCNKDEEQLNDELKNAAPEVESEADAPAEEISVEDQLASAKEELEKAQKEYLFLMAEFDNFRKRTLKEKADLIKNGGEKAMRELLPVVDDFERALGALEQSADIESLKDGVMLIYNKFVKYLESQQVKAMESTGMDFDADVYEAVTTFPAPEESMKGKVIDTVQKGYTINDKVLRHAKVVVGQ